MDGGDEGGYVTPTLSRFVLWLSPNSVFGSDFWKGEMNTVEDPYPAEGGFVKGSRTNEEREARRSPKNSLVTPPPYRRLQLSSSCSLHWLRYGCSLNLRSFLWFLKTVKNRWVEFFY
ncbi:hypothetical protein RHMOL_Rhmol10G0107400 [Rhododendron molle]|uniref:Uncharacterized protein n=1 Tax=Rhododendron molle TaxID=49168 RepID=A0ACC0M1M4_RHOML|nr:hypothetical protein RHMOL_Rhmol10G0107400 [Rhododendron molle]